MNKPIHHNFKPLADLLYNADLRDSEFFAWDLGSHKVYDQVGQVECYYLKDQAGSMAIGWVHNLNAWGMNNFYLTKSIQNFLGCSEPDTQSVTLSGFIPNEDYYITWFPTRMNATVPSNDTIESTWDGYLTLDFSDHAMDGMSNNYLDTLHSDYAFVVAFQPVVRSMLANDEEQFSAFSDWDFGMYPNPAKDLVHLDLPTDDVRRDVSLLDQNGKAVYACLSYTKALLDIPVVNLSRGTYCVRVSDGTANKMKILVIN